MNNWAGRGDVEHARQFAALATLAERVENTDHVEGLILIGSLAGGQFDELSDVDVLVVTRNGEFEQAWKLRHSLSDGCLARWDQRTRPTAAGHNWLTRDLVKIDCTIVDPSGSEKPLAAPFVVCIGSAAVVERFPTASLADVREHARQLQAAENARPVEPETMPYGELIDWKISEFKYAVRRAPRS